MIDAGQELRDHLRPALWSTEREDRVLAAIQRRRQSNTLSTVAVSSAVAAVAIALAIMWLARDQRAEYGSSSSSASLSSKAQAPAEGSAHAPVEGSAQALDSRAPISILASEAPKPDDSRPKPAIRLDDGSTVLALGSSDVRLVSQTDTAASFEVDAGKVWFDVQPEATRTIEVRIADVRVEVLATEFVVEKKGQEVFVWVQRGSAMVSSQGQKFRLRENEEGSFPAHEDPTPSSTQPEEAAAAATKASTTNKIKRRSVGRSSVIELWSLADTARLEGRLPAAIQALRSLVNEYPEDPRAALAAFTLGRLLLKAKASPRRAARAFERARTLAPRAPLVEDALAREIDALWQAKADARALERTQLYERLFPKGRHIERNRKRR